MWCCDGCVILVGKKKFFFGLVGFVLLRGYVFNYGIELLKVIILILILWKKRGKKVLILEWICNCI